jgi:chitinase
VSGYYAGYFPEMYPHDKIDFSALTHLLIARASVGIDGSLTQAIDIDGARGMARLRDLGDRAHAAGKKSLVMLGGEGEGGAFRGAASASARPTFVANILAFLDATHQDGVDLDWEESIDYADFLALAQDLRAERPGIVLTVPVFPVNVNFGLSPDVRAFVAAVHPYADQVNVMTYGIGMAGPWGGWVTWHTGALLGEGPDHPTSVSSTLAAYHAAGVPKAKLGMGIGFFGIDYRPPNTAPYQVPGDNFGGHDVEYRYSRIAQYLEGHEANRVWDDNARMHYLSFPGGYSPGAGYSLAGFLSYEDERSIAEKGAWLKTSGYGGAILWTLNYACLNPSTGDNPLLDATKQAFLP